MALIECRACSKKVSDSATLCPSCKTPEPGNVRKHERAIFEAERILAANRSKQPNVGELQCQECAHIKTFKPVGLYENPLSQGNLVGLLSRIDPVYTKALVCESCGYEIKCNVCKAGIFSAVNEIYFGEWLLVCTRHMLRKCRICREADYQDGHDKLVCHHVNIRRWSDKWITAQSERVKNIFHSTIEPTLRTVIPGIKDGEVILRGNEWATCVVGDDVPDRYYPSDLADELASYTAHCGYQAHITALGESSFWTGKKKLSIKVWVRQNKNEELMSSAHVL